MKMLLVLILGIVTSVQAGVNSIYGGEFDRDNRWNSSIALSMRNSIFCSGTIVDRNLVLTAAHCVAGIEARFETAGQVLIGVGGFMNSWEKALNVKKVIVHPKYNGNNDFQIFDYALLVLRDPAPSTINIIPMLSPIESRQLFGRQHLEIMHVGFGKRENGASGKKYHTTSAVTRVYDYEFIAGLGDGRGSCYGDSGGSTFARLSTGDMRLIGVTVGGPSHDGRCETAGAVYGRVDIASDWIADLQNSREI